jgi:hypothetical protein
MCLAKRVVDCLELANLYSSNSSNSPFWGRVEAVGSASGLGCPKRVQRVSKAPRRSQRRAGSALASFCDSYQSSSLDLTSFLLQSLKEEAPPAPE